VLSASRDELISMLHEKGAFTLGRTLLDMGVTISATQAQGGDRIYCSVLFCGDGLP
jgi:hypothetical protein